MANTGIEIREITTASASTVAPPTAVIALIGSAPIGPVNEVTLCKNATDDAQFGYQVAGFSIPQALSAIRLQAPNAEVMVVNVALDTYGDGIPLVPVTNETKTLVAGAAQLNYAPEGAIVVKDNTLATTYTLTTDYTISSTGAFARNPSGAIGATDTIKISYSHLENHTFSSNKIRLNDPPFVPAEAVVVYSKTKATTYVAGTDYTLNAYGVITRINSGAITSTQEVIVKYQAFAGISASDIIGTASPITGLYCYDTARAVYGYEPTLWIAPSYDALSGVQAAFQAQVAEKGGIFFTDGTAGRSVSQIVTDRAPGSGNHFQVQDERVVCCYPRVYTYSPAIDDDELRPSSPFMAGYFAKVDTLVGPYRSAGNFHFNNIAVPLIGVNSLELLLTYQESSTRSCDVKTLADAGVLTIKPGNVPYGFRSSAYPESNDVKTQYCVSRVRDLAKAALIKGMTQFIGREMSVIVRDAILQNANAFLNDLVRQGWILQGAAIYNVSDNPDAQIALGHWTFAFSYMPSIALEKLTFLFNVTTEGIAEVLGA